MTGYENTALVIKSQNGDEEALDELCRRNMGLVKSIASRYLGRGTDIEDLVQIGSVGLIKAARAFKIELGYEFSTYAFTMINGEIRRFLRDDGIIKVSRDTKRKSALILHKKELYITEFGKEPTILTLAELCGLSADEISYCLASSEPVVSSQEAHGEDGCTLEALLGYDDTERDFEYLVLKESISRLSSLEKAVINLRYFKGFTQAEVGKILGITQVKVSRTEKKAIEGLKMSMK